MNCIYPNCDQQAVEGPAKSNQWCHQHYGLYPHPCVHTGCDRTVQYDDEPWCFTHSPDEGSSVKGYSAHQQATTASHPVF